VRALRAGQPIPVRNRTATRPWQHVLEPLSGYLWLGAALANPEIVRAQAAALPSAFNFGPGHDSNRTVADLVAEFLKHWPGSWEDRSDPKAVHEAKLLQLTTDKAHALLGWAPVWGFGDAIEQTACWYRTATEPGTDVDFDALTLGQIAAYEAAARAHGLPWAAA
jgi:CDP-glucose 4,6-dehydratase